MRDFVKGSPSRIISQKKCQIVSLLGLTSENPPLGMKCDIEWRTIRSIISLRIIFLVATEEVNNFEAASSFCEEGDIHFSLIQSQIEISVIAHPRGEGIN